MMRRAGMALAIAALVALAAPGEALACACCTNPGQRYVDVETLDPGRLEEIESLRFGKEARLFVGEAGVEAIKGIQNPAERYELRVDWNKTHAAVGKTDLNFTLTNPGGWSGTLSLRLPQNHLHLRGRPARQPRSRDRAGALQRMEADRGGHGHRRVQRHQQSETGSHACPARARQ
jgi:hypothetical protein